MYIGDVIITTKVDDKLYIVVKNHDYVEPMVISKENSIIALCDAGYNKDDSKPTITTMNYDNFIQNIKIWDENDLEFIGELKHIHGISII